MNNRSVLRYVVVVHAPQGSLAATFDLQPDRAYFPHEVLVQQAESVATGNRTLVLRMGRLPTEEEFRVLAAHAATRAAQTGDDVRQLINLLIPL